jgi:hypothetical protein
MKHKDVTPEELARQLRVRLLSDIDHLTVRLDSLQRETAADDQQRLDWAHQCRVTDGNAAQAADLLMADVAGRDLFKCAQYEVARRRVQL